MTYMKVAWKHSLEDEPVEIWSELDSERNETRKIERFRNNLLNFASGKVRQGAVLSESPLPTLEMIARDPQFEAVGIEPEEFERAWHSAVLMVAA